MKLINAEEAFRILSEYYHHRTEAQADALREALGRVPEAQREGKPMTASEYLNQIQLIEAKIAMQQREIEKLKARSETAGMTEEQRESLGNCQKKLSALIVEAAERSQQIEETVDQVITDPREYEILRLRYWYGLQWYDIAKKVALEISWVYRLHKRALQRIAQHLEPEEKTKQPAL